MSAFQKYRVTVAHCDPAEQQRISRLLANTKLFQVIFTTCSGEACVRQVLRDRPELVVADTLLMDLDGLETLRRIKAEADYIKVILLTGYSALMHSRIALEQADYCLVVPYDDGVLADRATELMHKVREDFPFHLVSELTAAHLAVLNAPPRLKGYPYVRSGVQLAVYDPNVLRCHGAPNGLYSQLCRQYQETYRNVERNIRSVGEHIEGNAGLAVLQDYFSPADLQRKHITNFTLISTLAARITGELQLRRGRSLFQGD